MRAGHAARQRRSHDRGCAPPPARRQGRCIVSRSDDQPAWFVGMGKTVDAPNPTAVFKYDARTAELIHDLPQQQGVMYVIRALHVELLGRAAGHAVRGRDRPLLRGRAGLRRGALRALHAQARVRHGARRGIGARRGTSRLRWLDLHNFLGIVATGLAGRGQPVGHHQHAHHPADRPVAAYRARQHDGRMARPAAGHRARLGAGGAATRRRRPRRRWNRRSSASPAASSPRRTTTWCSCAATPRSPRGC